MYSQFRALKKPGIKERCHPFWGYGLKNHAMGSEHECVISKWNVSNCNGYSPEWHSQHHTVSNLNSEQLHSKLYPTNPVLLARPTTQQGLSQTVCTGLDSAGGGSPAGPPHRKPRNWVSLPTPWPHAAHLCWASAFPCTNLQLVMTL